MVGVFSLGADYSQRCVQAHTHQVKPVVFYIIGRIERVPARFKRFVLRLCDQPVVRLRAGGVDDGGVSSQTNEHLHQ